MLSERHLTHLYNIITAHSMPPTDTCEKLLHTVNYMCNSLTKLILQEILPSFENEKKNASALF